MHITTSSELIGSGLRWRRDGTGWALWLGRRCFGRVVQDAKYPGMFRVALSGDRSGDMANLPWAKNAYCV